MSTNTDSVIGAYEKKLSTLEAEDARFEDMQRYHRAPDGNYEEKLEPLFAFLVNPWKIWKNGHINLRRIVLKLVFADRIAYHRNEGARTANLSLPFNFLRMFQIALWKMVRAVGLEPTRAYAPQILSLVCLPFHHARIRRIGHSCRPPLS